MITANSNYPNTDQQSEWVYQAKNGNRAAFGKIVEKYYKPVFNLCYNFLSNINDAEDATQETFLRSYTRLWQYEESRRFSAWLYAIARNYCLDQLKKKRVQTIPWDSLSWWNGLDSGTIPQPETVFIKTETKRELRKQVVGLPGDFGAIVTLKYWDDLSCGEIADMFHTSAGAIKSRLFRARKMMNHKVTWIPA